MANNRNSEHNKAKFRERWLARNVISFMAVFMILFACASVAPAGAILNCLNPNMFKMNKGNMHHSYGAERANWYPQSHLPYQPNYYGHTNYDHNPMKFLFQPKWRGSSLFGQKGWNSWKMGPNSNFYRPGYGYGASMTGGASSLGAGSYQLNAAPLTMPTNPYLSSSSNDGWSAPVVYSQQTQLNNYDTYGHQPNYHPPKQQLAPLIDPYSIKGVVGGNKFPGTTKNIMQATGYNLFDEPVSGLNKTYGYAYPDWYSGVESPAKIAQKLMRYGLKNQPHQNRSAPLIQGPQDHSPLPGASNSKYTILDEPRFVGYGTIDSLSNKEARLSCSFNEAIDQANRPLWVKFLGPYNSSRILDSKVVPPFNCANSQCRTQEIESTKDYRYKFDNGPATSTLIIAEPRLSDYGVYRCSALTKTINNNPLETIYQIVHLGII